jgi:hypothetical protein
MRCHPRERGDPYHANIGWIPTFVGMTIAEVLVFIQSESFGHDVALIDPYRLKLGIPSLTISWQCFIFLYASGESPPHSFKYIKNIHNASEPSFKCEAHFAAAV